MFTHLNRLVALSVFIAATSASANFVVLDADFQDETTGAQIPRGGADLRQPVPGLSDASNDVVLDFSGEKVIEIPDNSAGSAEILYFALTDNRSIDNGKLVMNFEVAPIGLEDYVVLVVGPDEFTDLFFALSFNSLGELYWEDGNTVPTLIGTYTSGQLIEVDLSFDLNAGEFTLLLNDVPIVADQPFGTLGAIERLLVGCTLDGDQSGAIRFNDPFIYHTPSAGDELLIANFNTKTLDQPIGTGGPTLGEPISTTGLATVRNGVFATKNLELCGLNSFGSTAGFEFPNSEVVNEGDLSVRWRYSVQSFGGTSANAGIFGPGGNETLQVTFTTVDQIRFYDEASEPVSYHTMNYTVGEIYDFDVAVDLDNELLYVWVNGELEISRRATGVVGWGVDHFRFFNSGLNSDCFRVDRIRIYRSGGSTDVSVAGGSIPMPAMNLVAAPNPFNPTTSIRFALDRAGQAQLDVYDITGRLVTTLLDGHRDAGAHQITWNGRDASGHPVGSGVYHARFTNGRRSESTKLTLVR